MAGSGPHIVAELVRGCPAAIDAIAQKSDASLRFLRASWFDARRTDTLLGRHGDGTPFAAMPVAPLRAPLPVGRTLASGYWPFRSPVIASGTPGSAIAALMAHPLTARALSPLWRLGPTYADDPAAGALLRGARKAGWTVLTRRLGQIYRLDLGALMADGDWPRKSTRRSLARHERRLGERGAPHCRTISGGAWHGDVFDELAGIERRSWVGRQGDISGAKFLTAAQRRPWRRAVADPELARRLSATILYAGDHPVAFSFDLQSGHIQYSIASSYDADFSACRPGKIVSYRQFREARRRDVAMVDLGLGDSGYKREMGARRGPDVHDYVVVRHRAVAALLRARWEGHVPSLSDDPAPVPPVASRLDADG